jgi:hypothetical protein
VLGTLHVAFFVWVVSQRFRFPAELEWMSGGVAEHVDRVLRGEEIYVAPSARFVPYLYPPLHYWLSAVAAKVMTVPAACRVVSILATVVTGACVYRATKHLAQSTYWALVATSLFVGAYSITGYWYDLDRADTLATALLTSAFLVLLRPDSVRAAAVAGALLGLAFLAKQPGLVFLCAAIVALVLERRIRSAIAVIVGAAAVLVPLVLFLVARSDGWFWFYCIKMPASHGIDPKLFTQFFVVDASKMFAIVAAVGFVVVEVLGRLRRMWTERASGGSTEPNNELLFGAFVVAGLFTSATSRLHIGGYVNVLVFLTTFGAIAFGVVCARLTKRHSVPVLEGVLALAALLQLGHFLYDPDEAAPDKRRVLDAKLIEGHVRRLEQKGEVIAIGRAHLTKVPHFHIMGLMDVLRAGLPVPDDLRTGLKERRYAAYIVDEFGELGLEAVLGHRSEHFELVVRNYFIAQRFDDRERRPVVGWIAHPSWVFRPRTTPLDTMTIPELERRLRIETGIAEMRMRAVQAGAAEVDDGAEVELLASKVDTAAPAKR